MPSKEAASWGGLSLIRSGFLVALGSLTRSGALVALGWIICSARTGLAANVRHAGENA